VSVTNPKEVKVLTNETPVYVAIKVVPQTTKQAERGNLPTFSYATLCLTPILEEAHNTLIVRMY
jgi:hypothetical protein